MARSVKKKQEAKKRPHILGIVRRYQPQVEAVVDALENMNIEVRDSDAKGATALSPTHCALAEACARHVDAAIIGLGAAYLIKGKIAVRYLVPQAIQREIVTFDRNKDFRSGNFTLRAPAGTERLGARGERIEPTGKRDASRTKKALHITQGVRKL